MKKKNIQLEATKRDFDTTDVARCLIRRPERENLGEEQIFIFLRNVIISTVRVLNADHTRGEAVT